jgi:hypothetical protein
VLHPTTDGSTTMRASRPASSARVVRSLIPARIDRLPWTPFHTRLVAALGVAWVLDGLEITVASSVAGVRGLPDRRRCHDSRRSRRSRSRDPRRNEGRWNPWPGRCPWFAGPRCPSPSTRSARPTARTPSSRTEMSVRCAPMPHSRSPWHRSSSLSLRSAPRTDLARTGPGLVRARRA